MRNKKNFFIIHFLMIIFVLLFNNTVVFMLHIEHNPVYLLLLTLLSFVMYIYVNYSLLDDIFKIDKNLQDKLEKTMHEINTPVSTIELNTNMIEKNITNDKDKQRLKRIHKSCDNLKKLYKDMEYFISKETQNINFEVCLLKDIIDDVLIDFDSDDSKVIIRKSVDDTKIYVDKYGFSTMLSNLIGNAFKHNINLTKIDITLKNNILSIKDDGIGISEYNLQNIFTKYYQGDTNSDGFGLGLSIVKEFCDKNLIKINIQTSSSGTIFNLNLSSVITKNI